MITQGMYIGDRYEIIEKIGTGGMSDVYKAMDHTLDRYVAIKVLKEEFSKDVNFVTKFRTEASSAAKLEHPNIVNIYDVGSQNEFHYIVMELIDGITLKTYIEKKGQLTFKEAASIAIQVGRGIEAAHNKGIIHRDIKPQNIIISTEGKVKVTDFGIAKAVSTNTISSDVMGSVHYSSPEQARNGFVDGKSDIYSLGIVMYEMVTGRVPFDGDTTVSVAIQHLQEEMVSPSMYAPDIPVSMEKIILKCTQKNPDRRYESMTALLSDLRKALITPNEDFVVIAPVSQDKTRIIGADEVDKIKSSTGRIYVDEETLVGNAFNTGKIAEQDEDEDEDDFEEEVDPRMDKIITIAGIAAGVGIVILIIVILVSFLGGFRSNKKKPSDTQQSQTTETQKETETQKNTEGGVKVEDVTGMTMAEAKELLNKSGLGVRKAATEASDEYEEGEIIRQTPEAGSMTAANSTIEVTVSSGPARIDIPNVKGMTEAEAEKTLKDAGFSVTSTQGYSDTVEKGNVISQTPGANSLGNKGDTITLVISQGPEIKIVKVPNVLTMSKDAAVQTLEASKLTAEVVTEYSDTVAADCVISQSIPADTQVTEKSSVKITVSLGVKPAKVSYVVGMSQDAAVAALQGLGLKVTVETAYSDTVESGIVISQSIAADTEVAKGSTIIIKVSSGKQPIRVLNVVGMDKSTAVATLQGLTITVVEEHSDTVAAGIVISQSVAENTEVQPGSNITIVVSTGPAVPATTTESADVTQ